MSLCASASSPPELSISSPCIKFFICAVNCSHIYIIILETLPINEVEVAESLFSHSGEESRTKIRTQD
jgi:uncharacterized membrane protein